MKANDTYKTIAKPSQGELFKDKNSKFYGYVFPVTSEEHVTHHLNYLRKEHHAARHWCYAYQIGTETTKYRANDDGEPNNSAGMPIYGQIQSYDLTNILIIIVRYYGGVKLGVGGLINAYRTAAKSALDSSKVIECTINKKIQLKFDYKNMSKVMRILKENNIAIINQNLESNCLLEISVRKSNFTKVVHLFEQFYGVEVAEL